MDYEKRAAELMEELAAELYKKRQEAFQEFDREEAALSDKKAKAGRKKRRAIIWAAGIFLCVFLTGLATVQSEAFRLAVFGFFFSEEKGHSDMIRQESGAKSAHIRKPGYLPEGYVKQGEEKFDSMHTLTYKNRTTGDTLFITQINDKSFAMSIDSETSKKEACTVKTCEAYYVGGNDNHMLMWEEDGVYFEITSKLDQETLIKIANNLT